MWTEFIQGISQFSVKGDRETKLKCMIAKNVLMFLFYRYQKTNSNQHCSFAISCVQDIRHGPRWIYI